MAPPANNDAHDDAALERLSPALDALLAEPEDLFGFVSGGGLLDDIVDALGDLLGFPGRAVDWLWDRFLDVYGWLQDVVLDLASDVQVFASWVYNQVTAFIRPLYDAVAGVASSAYDAASWLLNQVLTGVAGITGVVYDAASWLLAQVLTGVSGITGVVYDAASWLLAQVLTGVAAVADWVWAAAEWVADRLSDGYSFLAELVSDTGSTVVNEIVEQGDTTINHVTDVGQWVGEQVIAGVSAGAEALGEGFLAGLSFLVETAFAPFVGSFQAHEDIRRRLLAAEYPDASALFEDIASNSVGSTITAFMEFVIGNIAEVAPLFFGVGGAYAERNVQEAQERVRSAMPALQDLRAAFLRGFIEPADHDAFLARYGFPDETIETFKQLYFQPPPPQDTIRFAVREVYDDRRRQELQLDEDFPDAFAAAAQLVGINEEQARNYWAAHWNLPSPQQVYTMRHRELVSPDELDAYLKAADFSPAWRPLLAEISHLVPGRVDLRRLYRSGVFDEPRVKKGYVDLGYDEADAQALTDFAIADAQGSGAELPRTTITRFYREGHLDRSTAEGELAALGFDADGVALLLDFEDLQNAQELAALEEDIVEADFKAGVVSESDARGQLDTLGVPSERVDLLIRRWTNRAAVRTRSLTVSQVQRLFRAGVLTEDQVLGRFRAEGYNDEDAQGLIELARPDTAGDEPAQLTLSQTFRAWRAGLIDEDAVRARLSRRGFVADDVDTLVSLETPDAAAGETAELTKADIRSLLREGLFDQAEARRRLLLKGYPDTDADLLLSLWTAP